MKTIKILAITAMTAALTACSNDDEVMSNYPSDNIVRITASVGEAATRASYDGSNLKEFGLCLVNEQDTNYTYHNLKVTNVNGTWTPEKQMLWQNKDTKVTIVAYAPYMTRTYYGGASCVYHGYTAARVESDQSDATDCSSDYLVYKKENFDPSTELDGNGCIPIAFSHLFSQLNINLTFGTEFNEGQSTGYLTSNPITSIKVGGCCILANVFFDTTPVSTTPATNDQSNFDDVTPHEVSNSFTAATANDKNAKVQYSCILVPQTIKAGDFSVTFTIGQKVYVWKSSADFTLESGHQHALNLTIGKDVVELGSFTIKPWEDAATETLATE